MNVRCTRCRAVYTLEDVLYGGAEFKPLPASLPVECARCAYVFEAPVPGKGGPRISTPKLAAVPKADAPRTASNDRMAKALKPRRPGEEPGAAEHPVRAAPIRAAPDEEEGEFERAQRQRQQLMRRLLVGLAVAFALAVVVLAGVLIKRKLSSGLPKEAQSKVEKARGKLLLDDEASLGDAVKLFHEAARLAPGEAQPEADLAYASLLLSEAHREQAGRIEAQAKLETDQVSRLQIQKPAGWEAQAAAQVEKVKRLAEAREPHVQESQRLLREAHAAATAAADDDAEDAAVVRAQALYWAVTDPEKGQHYLQLAEARTAQGAQKDALMLYVKAAAALAGPRSRDKQDRALSALAEVQQADPRFLRAVYDSAAIAADRQQYGPAREALQRLLSANGQHERGKALLEQLPSAAP